MINESSCLRKLVFFVFIHLTVLASSQTPPLLSLSSQETASFSLPPPENYPANGLPRTIEGENDLRNAWEVKGSGLLDFGLGCIETSSCFHELENRFSVLMQEAESNQEADIPIEELQRLNFAVFDDKELECLLLLSECIRLDRQEKKNRNLPLFDDGQLLRRSSRILEEDGRDQQKQEEHEPKGDPPLPPVNQQVQNEQVNTTVILLLIAICMVISILAIVFCIRVRRNKKKQQSEEAGMPNGILKRIEKQKLMVQVKGLRTKNTAPEFSFVTAGMLKPIKNIFLSDTNTGLSPLNEIKSFQHLKLEENQRSSMVPEEVILTNIDNNDGPDSLSSSRSSIKNTPRNLDFQVEFSIIEPPDTQKLAQLRGLTEN